MEANNEIDKFFIDQIELISKISFGEVNNLLFSYNISTFISFFFSFGLIRLHGFAFYSTLIIIIIIVVLDLSASLIDEFFFL